MNDTDGKMKQYIREWQMFHCTVKNLYPLFPYALFFCNWHGIGPVLSWTQGFN